MLKNNRRNVFNMPGVEAAAAQIKPRHTFTSLVHTVNALLRHSLNVMRLDHAVLLLRTTKRGPDGEPEVWFALRHKIEIPLFHVTIDAATPKDHANVVVAANIAGAENKFVHFDGHDVADCVEHLCNRVDVHEFMAEALRHQGTRELELVH